MSIHILTLSPTISRETRDKEIGSNMNITGESRDMSFVKSLIFF